MIRYAKGRCGCGLGRIVFFFNGGGGIKRVSVA